MPRTYAEAVAYVTERNGPRPAKPTLHNARHPTPGMVTAFEAALDAAARASTWDRDVRDACA